MMTVEQQNLAYMAVSALEGIHKAIVEFRGDYLDVHGRREIKPRRFEVGHSSMLKRFGNSPSVHIEKWRAFLTLLDAIDAAYLTEDNAYGDLDRLVADKVQYVKSLFPNEDE